MHEPVMPAPARSRNRTFPRERRLRLGYKARDGSSVIQRDHNDAAATSREGSAVTAEGR